MKYLAAVAVSSTNFGFDRRYKYTVPVEMEENVFVGAKVLVPLSKGNRKRVAVVIGFDDAVGEDFSLFKPINFVIDSEPLLNKEMQELMMWIRNKLPCVRILRRSRPLSP